MFEIVEEQSGYEAYKSSTLPWLEKMPANWIEESGKWLFSKAERPVQVDDDIVTCFRDGEVTLRKNRRVDGFTNAIKEHGYQRIEKGDLVIHAMDAFAGAIGVSDSDGKSTPVYSACVPRQPNTVCPYYFAYQLRDIAHSGVILSLAKGIRERSTDFRFNDFGAMQFAVPSYNEQLRITKFLDDKTQKIDRAIAIKEAQIARLEERKQILIQTAVTRGLDPNVPMKDSGVDWIGQIPAHWEVWKLKYLVSINDCVLPETTEQDVSIEYVDIGSVSLEKGIETTQIFDFRNAPSRARRIAMSGDTIISTVRTYLKAIAFIDTDASKNIYSTGFAILRPSKRVFPEFLSYCVKADYFTNQVDIFSKGVSYPAINSDDLGAMLVFLPPFNEQKEITNFVKASLKLIFEADSSFKKAIKTLKEYRTSLINAAVTGKIKVPS